LNGDEWRWKTEREIISRSFVEERERAKTVGERELGKRRRKRGEWREESFFIIRIMKGTATAFPNALGNTVAIIMFTQI
jgi:hypothetical protein